MKQIEYLKITINYHLVKQFTLLSSFEDGKFN